MNGNDVKISVLITFYNQEKYVDRALESVLSQCTNFEFKVIVGDDGSTDGTMRKIKNWQEKHPDVISVIRQTRVKNENRIVGSRASKNRLSLLSKVDTPYFIFLDGDDYWIDNKKLQRQYDVLEDEKNADCVASAHQIMLVHEDCPNDFKLLPEYLERKKFSLKEYWKKYYFHTDTILFRSKHIADIRYDLLEETFNDNLITYSFMQFGKIHYMPYNMAVYCQNKQGIWAGEKYIIGLIRNIMSYDIEVKINKELKETCRLRHIYDFIHFKRYKGYETDIDDVYLQFARKNSLKTMENAICGGFIVSRFLIVDIFWLFCIMLKQKVVIRL